jgi:hypothetical protein
MLLTTVLFGILLFQTNAAFAQNAKDNTPAITVSDEIGKVGGIVEVSIGVVNNPGITDVQLLVAYDASVLKIVGVADGGKIGQSMHTPNYSLNPYKLTWWNPFASTDFANNDIIAKIRFEIIAEADRSPVAVTPGSVTNQKGLPVLFDVVNGSVSATPKDVEKPKPAIHVSNETGKVGETVEVSISIENNPGITDAQFSVSYNASVLKLTGIVDGGKLGQATHTSAWSSNPYPATWWNPLSSTDFDSDGVIAKLRFEMLSEADRSPVTITYSPGNIRNKNNDIISFDIVNGSVTAETAPSAANPISKAGLLAYPNPVKRGGILNIEGVAAGSPIEVYNLSGQCVYRTVATDSPASIILNVPPGVYPARTSNGEVIIVIN